MNYGAVRVLSCDEKGQVAAIQQSILAGAGVRKFRSVTSLPAYCEELKAATPDLVLVNLESEDEVGAAIRITRDNRFCADPSVPVIASIMGANKTRVRRALFFGSDSVVTLPLQAVIFLRHVDRVLTKDRIFVRTKAYFGPDRRRTLEFTRFGDERRCDDPKCEVIRVTCWKDRLAASAIVRRGAA